jgi:hypothetical protein
MNMNMKVTVIAGLATLLGLLMISFLLSWPVMMLWNGCLVPAVEGAKEVSWLQAWGIQVLFGVLFKSGSHTSK